MENTLVDKIPFNLTLLNLTEENVKAIRPVKVLDIFQNMSRNFHSDGLYSTETFGKPGSTLRSKSFSYIRLNTKILHPKVYQSVIALRELYAKIMAGHAYAIFDEEEGDFIESDIIEGKTGYKFFTDHLFKLKLDDRGSTERRFSIDLLNSQKTKVWIDKLLVLPAGLRDYRIDDNGKPTEDDVNDLYRRVLAQANTLEGYKNSSEKEEADGVRHQLQTSVLDVYKYFVNILDGKGGFVQRNWTTRNVYNSTRNVITANISKTQVLGDALTITTNDTIMGLYQAIRLIFPVAVNRINSILSAAFPGSNVPSYLINKETMKRNTVPYVDYLHDMWMTYDGLEKVFANMEAPDIRSTVIEFGQYYLALLYNDGKEVKIVFDPHDLPEGRDKKYLKPITYAELFYIAIKKDIDETIIFNTRYPIESFGSVYPSNIYLKTTVDSEIVQLLDDTWQPVYTLNEFPKPNIPFVNSMSPHTSHLKGLGADFDGDVCSATSVLSDEARDECRKCLKSRNYYVDVNNEMSFSADNDISTVTFLELSAEPA
jgi:hypothetical protein